MQSAVGREAGRFFGELEVTTAQMRVLGQLRHRGRMSGKELAGVLRRGRDPSDRRLAWVELTPAGEAFFRGLWLSAGEKARAAIARFTPEERATFERLMNQIADHLEKSSAEAKGPR